MKVTVSNIKTIFYLWFVFMLGSVVFFVFLLSKSIKVYHANGVWATIGWCSILIVMLLTVLIILKDIKYLVITSSHIKTYSIYHLFGKRYKIADYVGVIISKEYGSLGSYDTVYLVNNHMYTALKINGLFYINSNDLLDAIALPEIKNYKFTITKYFQLLLSGKMKVETKRNRLN